MKKIITLLLLGALALSFTACNSEAQINELKEQISELEDSIESNQKSTNKIVGTWNFASVGVSLQFNSDFTGEWLYSSEDSPNVSFRWSYDADANVYFICTEGKAYVYYAYLNEDGNLEYYGETATKVSE